MRLVVYTCPQPRRATNHLTLNFDKLKSGLYPEMGINFWTMILEVPLCQTETISPEWKLRQLRFSDTAHRFVWPRSSSSLSFDKRNYFNSHFKDAFKCRKLCEKLNLAFKPWPPSTSSLSVRWKIEWERERDRHCVKDNRYGSVKVDQGERGRVIIYPFKRAHGHNQSICVIGAVWPDWAILESSWQWIRLQK